MRSQLRGVVVLSWLPVQTLCLGLKLEGLIDLGPKWDYAYKLTPITANTPEDNEQQAIRNGLNKIRIDGNEVNLNNLAETIDSNKNIVLIHKIREDASPDYISPDFDGGMKVIPDKEENSDVSNEDNSEVTNEPKYTKQYDLYNTHLIDDLDGNNERNKVNKLAMHDGGVESNYDVPVTSLNITNSILRLKHKSNEKLKDNTKLKDFTIHILNESLQIFDKIKKLTDDERVKKDLKTLKQNYKDKFGDFLKEINDHTLKTTLANQNVILHAIEVNNAILRRIVNHLTDKENAMRVSGIINVFRNEVEKEKQVEIKHACGKLSICRSNDEYSAFIVSILDIILTTDELKMKQASDAMTEAIKTNDFTNIIDSETQDRLRKLMTIVELWDPFLTKSMFLMLRNVIAYKNFPIVVMHASELEAINNTILVHRLIDILDKNMGTVENKKEWKDIKKYMEEWRDGKVKDVQKSIDSIIRQLKNVFGKVDAKVRKAVNDTLKTLLDKSRIKNYI